MYIYGIYTYLDSRLFFFEELVCMKINILIIKRIRNRPVLFLSYRLVFFFISTFLSPSFIFNIYRLWLLIKMFLFYISRCDNRIVLFLLALSGYFTRILSSGISLTKFKVVSLLQRCFSTVISTLWNDALVQKEN